MIFLEQKWLWAKFPIKLLLRVLHRSSGLNHTMQVVAQHSCTSLPAEAVVCWSRTAVMGTASAPVAGDTAPTNTGQTLLFHKLSLCSAPALALSPGCVSQAQHCHQLFVIQLILPSLLHQSRPTLHWHLSYTQIYLPCHFTLNCHDIWISLSLASQGSGFKHASK